MNKKTRFSLVLISVILITTIAIVLFISFPTQSIDGYSSDYYGRNGDVVLLHQVKDNTFEYVTGYSAMGLNGGGRTWLSDWANEGKVLNPVCRIEGRVYNTRGTGESWGFDLSGDASLSGSDLICTGWNFPYTLTQKPSNYKYGGVVVTWNFIKESDLPVKECLINEENCVGKVWYTCTPDNTWGEQGEVIGKCGVTDDTCTNGETQCSGELLQTCVGLKWNDGEKIVGKCGVIDNPINPLLKVFLIVLVSSVGIVVLGTVGYLIFKKKK